MFEFVKRMPDKQKIIFKNFFSLSSIEIANYFLPLLSFPYLVRVLGPDKFGLISFAQAIAQYFLILVDYGFTLSATKNIAIHRHDRVKTAEIYNSVMLIKLTLSIIGLTFLIAIVNILGLAKEGVLVFLFSYGLVFASVLLPAWFFQGEEDMKFIAWANIISKVLFLTSVFILIKREDDYLLAPLLLSLTSIFAGLLSLVVIRREFGIKFFLPSWRCMFFQLRDGWEIFISRLAVSFYTNSSLVILGFLTNNATVGFYSSAEKIIKAIARLLNCISQATYPYLNRLKTESDIMAILFIRKLFLIVSLIFLGISGILIWHSKFIVSLVLGTKYAQSVMLFQILAIMPFLWAVSNILGMQTMITFGMKREFSKSLILGCIANIMLSLFLTWKYGAVGMAYSVVLTELVVIFAMWKFSGRMLTIKT